MSFLGIGGGGNLFSSIAGLALQGALGVATGGASLLVTTALKSVLLAVGDQVLQQLGQQLGLPQGVIDVAQAAFHGAAGDAGGAVQNLTEASEGLSSAIGGGAFEAGEIERGAQSNIQDIVTQANEAANRSREDAASDESVSGSGKDSLLVAIAKAMGKVIDSKMGQMADKTQQMGSAKGEKYGQLSAEVQALGQEISMVSNALNNSIKAIGEASAQLARKG
ncbi:hypothetical protein [Caulobacter hibisci]|uniref:Uncharacterized protein n=1 Tax=Caulobacter hibisci TaxID=2035993 RepID=A0ABS0SVQ8_9CAUL|nr:hypothetical protein [Caulobacter hibisci]MBI1682717.1 hypothetical protein [Caulobacter hibisci]